MNKKNKVISLTLSLLLLLSVFSCFASAYDTFDGYDDFEAFPDEIEYKNSRFSVTVPTKYMIYNDTTGYYHFLEVDDVHILSNSEGSFIDIYSGSNDEDVPNNINKMNDEMLEIFAEYYLKPADGALINGVTGEYKNTQVKRTKINGCACACLSADYICRDGKETHEVMLYIFTTEHMVYALTFVSSGVFDRDAVLTVLSSFSMNDTHFEGDSELKSADFSDALPYKEAHESQLEQYGFDYFFSGVYDTQSDAESDAEFEKYWHVISLVVFIVPSVLIPLILLIILTALIYTNRKNKKKIAEYQNKYGNIF